MGGEDRQGILHARHNETGAEKVSNQEGVQGLHDKDGDEAHQEEDTGIMLSLFSYSLQMPKTIFSVCRGVGAAAGSECAWCQLRF